MIIKWTILLLIGLAFCEAHSFVLWLYPKTFYLEYNLYLDKSYKMKINVLWYLYELANILNRAIWCYVLYDVSKRVSKKFSRVAAIFMFYQSTQILFYIWNRNTSFLNNYFVYSCMVLCIIALFLPGKRQSKVFKIE